MERTQIADFIGKPDNAYALLALLSNNTQRLVGNLLKNLTAEIGEGLWVMPDEALHITLCEIIQSKPYSQDKQLIYEANKDAYGDVPARILKDIDPIKIHFNKIVVSPQAVTIQGEDDGSFNKIRHELVRSLPLPNETKMPPNVVHSSIARFTKELDLGDVTRVVAHYSIDCEELVDEFKLINNLTPPLLRYTTIRAYPLVG